MRRGRPPHAVKCPVFGTPNVSSIQYIVASVTGVIRDYGSAAACPSLLLRFANTYRERVFMPPTTAILRFAAVSFLSLAGCGIVVETANEARKAAERTRLSNDLKEFGLAYLTCCEQRGEEAKNAYGKGPMNWEQARSNGTPTAVQQRIEASGYKVVWGLIPLEAKKGTTNTIVAYPANAASAGGLVLFLDCHVELLTAAEFQKKTGVAP